jgi:hypothetical protein
MGANAQTTVPTFVSSQVLTADQQNQSARTGVPVFATTGTRDAAFGGSGEKTLAEGQLCYVEGTGLQSYNGTSWVTWGTAPSSGALTLISTTTIGSAVSSVTVSSAFSSTYDNYRIMLNGGSGSTIDYLYLTLGSTTSGYCQGGFDSTYSTSGLGSQRRNNAASWFGGYFNTAGINGVIELQGPNMTENTFIQATFADARTTERATFVPGFLNDTTAYTAFTLTTGAGTLTGGTIRVYGYANS